MEKHNPKGMDGSGKKSGNLHEGLKRTNPRGMDSSGTRTGHNINSEPTRSAVGGQPRPPGPRVA